MRHVKNSHSRVGNDIFSCVAIFSFDSESRADGTHGVNHKLNMRR